MSATGPLVSVIIPAYKARATLPLALASVRLSGLDLSRIEVVLAPDDGDAYDDLPDFGLRLVRCAPQPSGTGAGPARNRAITRATGQYIAFLDADDTWGRGYLATLLPLTQAKGAAFGETCIVSPDRHLPLLRDKESETLGFDDFARTGGSFHPVVQRDLAGPFVAAPSQDVLHAVEVLSQVGGRAPLGQVRYHLHLSPQSATADVRFAMRADAAYRAHIDAITQGRTRIRPAHIPAARAVFETKIRQNAAYMRDGAGQYFYAFMYAGPERGTHQHF